MNQEGMGRRFSQKDLKRDIAEQEHDVVEEVFDRLKTQVVRDLLAIDQRDKALTGRKVNQYEVESGMKESELFPQDARILNIGDPWQVLDREGIVNLEYETGEEADFVKNTEQFLGSVEFDLECARRYVETIAQSDSDFASELNWRVDAIIEFMEEGIALDDFPKQAKILYDITNIIREHHGNDDGIGTARELWYVAMRLARGFEDIYYTEKVILPAIQKETIANKGLTESQRAKLILQFIEAYRGRKKYKHAELVKGAFPDTDFEDKSFDRITASWSISAHMFGVMNEEQYRIVWRELDRLLKKDGVAYIWPLDYYAGSGEEMAETLREYRMQGGNVGIIDKWPSIEGYQIHWIDSIQNNEELASLLTDSKTLIFLPKGSGIKSIERIERELVAVEESQMVW